MRVKKYCFEGEYPQNILSLKEFQKWVKGNSIFSFKEFDIVEKNDDNIFIGCEFKKEKFNKKIEIINRFFKFQQALLPKLKIS